MWAKAKHRNILKASLPEWSKEVRAARIRKDATKARRWRKKSPRSVLASTRRNEWIMLVYVYLGTSQTFVLWVDYPMRGGERCPIWLGSYPGTARDITHPSRLNLNSLRSKSSNTPNPNHNLFPFSLYYIENGRQRWHQRVSLMLQPICRVGPFRFWLFLSNWTSPILPWSITVLVSIDSSDRFYHIVLNSSFFFAGRIGRIVLRNALENPEVCVNAINEYVPYQSPPISVYNVIKLVSLLYSPFIDLSYMVS